MGIMDKFKKQAEQAVDKHGNKIAKGLDKAASVVDSKTKGKHHGQINKGVAAAKNALDKLDGKNDDIADQPPASPATPAPPAADQSPTPPAASQPPAPPAASQPPATRPPEPPASWSTSPAPESQSPEPPATPAP